jgi:hypothetical protein
MFVLSLLLDDMAKVSALALTMAQSCASGIVLRAVSIISVQLLHIRTAFTTSHLALSLCTHPLCCSLETCPLPRLLLMRVGLDLCLGGRLAWEVGTVRV